MVKRTGKVVSVPVGETLIGRVVNALGQPIDAGDRSVHRSIGQLKVRRRVSVNGRGYVSRCRPVSRQLTQWFQSEEVSVS